jgi:hypothetical protein
MFEFPSLHLSTASFPEPLKKTILQLTYKNRKILLNEEIKNLKKGESSGISGFA